MRRATSTDASPHPAARPQTSAFPSARGAQNSGCCRGRSGAPAEGIVRPGRPKSLANILIENARQLSVQLDGSNRLPKFTSRVIGGTVIASGRYGTVPRTPTDIDAAAFREITGRSDVTAVHTEAVDHGTALRARLRIVGDPDLPQSAFVKLTPVRPAEMMFNRLMGLAHNEAELFRLLSAELSDVMPRGYGSASDRRRGRAIVIMEDLSDRGAEFVPLATGCTAAQAVAVAKTFGNLHRQFWMSDRLLIGDLAGFSPKSSRTTRIGPRSWHLLRTIPRSYDDIVPPDMRADARMLIKNRWLIARLLQTYPFSLVHGDTHLGNICFVGAQPVLFDWQLAACGPVVKDLSYFACTSIDPETRRGIDEELVRSYIAALNADGTTRLTFDEAWNSVLRLHRLHRGRSDSGVRPASSGRNHHARRPAASRQRHARPRHPRAPAGSAGSSLNRSVRRSLLRRSRPRAEVCRIADVAAVQGHDWSRSISPGPLRNPSRIWGRATRSQSPLPICPQTSTA